MNKNGRYSKDTEERVLRIIEEYGYSPNQLARGLRLNRGQIVGIIVPDITNEFFSKLIQRIQNRLFEHDYPVVIYNTNESMATEKKCLKYLRAQSVSGVVYINGSRSVEGDMLKDIPTVYIDRRPEDSPRPKTRFVSSDNEQGGYLATREMLEQGSRRVAVITERYGTYVMNERLRGYERALREFGIEPDPRLIIKPRSISYEAAYAATERLIREGTDFDALCCQTDWLASGAIDALRKNGLAVPGHVRVTGFDDISVSYLCYQPFTTVRQDFGAIGDYTADAIVDMISGLGDSEYIKVFPVELIRRLGGGLSYMIVSEAGASVYSASKLAAEEFPEYDVNLRSAVSIARRLQDPLAELVKIDPKAIGVGQYQHDMPQARLGEALDGVVEDCVNAVGVDANTASPSLLQRVSGLTAATARNLVRYREEHGAFTTRKQLLKVPKLGPKAYEQCAGFLRVPESPSILDHTGVHPESYGAAEKLLAACGYTQTDVETGGLEELKTRAEAIGLDRLAEICGAGAPTLADIIRELMKPGRDPRDELPAPILRTDVMELKDLKPGMELQGTVRNVIDFGVFVDIGVHQDGLVHISRLPRRVKHPSELLAVGDVVTVWVVDVEEKRGRIGLTMCRP